METNIRIAEINDYEKVKELALEVHSLHVKWRDDIFEEDKDVFTFERFNELIESENVFVVTHTDNVVAYITFGLKESNYPGLVNKRYLVLEALCVEEKYRSLGIGKSLLEFAERLALKKECTDLMLSVNKENHAGIKSYENFGFSTKSISYTKSISKR